MEQKTIKMQLSNSDDFWRRYTLDHSGENFVTKMLAAPV